MRRREALEVEHGPTLLVIQKGERFQGSGSGAERRLSNGKGRPRVMPIEQSSMVGSEPSRVYRSSHRGGKNFTGFGEESHVDGGGFDRRFCPVEKGRLHPS